MALFNLSSQSDINAGVYQYKMSKNAVLLDVRTPEEFAEGHIPESINIPLQTMAQVKEVVKDLSTPLYIYCRTGRRTKMAREILKTFGYSDVTDIGGITSYQGIIEK